MAGLDLNIDRRGFLASAGATALVVGAALSTKSRGQEAAEMPLEPNAFVRVSDDGTVTVIVKHIEFGQGPLTGLTTLVADEMDADWSQMRAELAPANTALYANSAFGIQGTGGSTAMPSSWEPMRKAGAQAKAVLVAAAAEEWGVPANEITVEKGRMRHNGSGKEEGFGPFVARAAALKVPESPTLKSKAERTLIGTDVPKLDSRAKSNGEAIFTIDVYREGMLTVAMVFPPVFGATIASFNAEDALKVPGVVAVERLPMGIAVYGENTYAALRGRNAVETEWSTANAETRSSGAIAQDYLARAQGGPGIVATDEGDVAGGLGGAEQTIDASYVFPFLAHTPMEPLDAVAEFTEDGAEIWMGSQLQTVDQAVAASTLGISDPTKVRVNTMLAGGSFGRRAQPTSHIAAEVAEALKKSPDRRPVKLIYTREDDVRGGYYRPLTVHTVRAGIDKEGNIAGWEQRIVTPSFIIGSSFEGMVQENGLDPTTVEGARETAYDIHNYKVSVHQVESRVPTLWWRSVGHTHTGYVLETMLDEILQMTERDPVEGRLALMKEDRREAGVLRRVADMADWGRSPGEGRAFGVAVHKSFGTYVAQIAEVSMDDGVPKLHKVWCAVDPGVAVNPNVIRAQMEGGIGFGAGAVLFDAIELGDGGKPLQANWDTYRMIRIHEMPEVEVAIVDSDESPTGVGEPGVPPIGPAIGNALRRLTGETPRSLPIVQTVEV